MLHFHDRAGFALALTLNLEPRLHHLLSGRIAALTDELIDFTEYLVVQSGDTEDDIVSAVGFSPLVEPIDGLRFGQPGFEPHWDWLSKHDGWFELVFTYGSTHALFVFVQDGEGGLPELREMCRQRLSELRKNAATREGGGSTRES